jgi:Cu-processing system permease protein
MRIRKDLPTLIIARLTFLEAVRRRIALAGLLLGVAFLILYALGTYFLREQVLAPGLSETAQTLIRNQLFSFLTMAGLYAVNFLSIAMGALLAADSLAGEIGSGTIQAIVTKPVRRAEVVFGKWLGFAGLLGLYLLLMAGGVLAIVYLLSGYHVQNMVIGMGLIYLESLLVMSITLALSSTISTLATGGVIFGLYGLAFIGGWVEQFGAFLRNQTTVNIGIITSLIMPSEALWRRAAYEMSSALTQTLGFGSSPFASTSVPSAIMVFYAGAYLVVALALAMRQFSARDL